jgi:pentatricopeptide repeat protein
VVNEKLLTLAEHLKSYGYSTGAFIGAYPLDSRFGLSQGFDVYDDDYTRTHAADPTSPERKAEAVVESALKWLKKQYSPWLLWIHCWDPHIPYEAPEPFKTQYQENPYEGEVAYVDFVLGKLFNYLKKNSLFDSTTVIFTGDHGESLGQHGEKTHGYFAYNATIWIPLIITIPQQKPRRIDHYVSHIDLFPTACDLLGLEKPSYLQGISLVPALKGKKLRPRPIYFESLYPFYTRGWAPLKGFIDQQKKFIDSPIPELYELEHDFDELKNLAGREKLEKYREQLEKIRSDQSPLEKIKAEQRVDRETREKLKSLGYVSSIQVTKKEKFGPEDDVKVLLPYVHKTNEAWDLYKDGKEDEGIKILSGILNERKDIDMVYRRLADIYKETGRAEKALTTLEQGLTAIPSSYETFLDYVEMLINVGQYDKAISLYQEMSFREIEIDPEAWNNLGIAQAKKGNFEGAIKSYKKGLSLDNRDPELHNNMGNAYYSFGLQTRIPAIFQNCLESYKKAIEIDPTYPTPYYGLGQAYHKLGNVEGAIYCWEKALEADPDFHQAHLDLALAYLDTGNKIKACEMLRDYKKRYYNLMSPAERANFDNLMRNCQNK